MSRVTVAELSEQNQGFYVPRFEVRIEGADLPQNALRDVVQVTYKDDIKTLDSFELTVNNWDAQRRRMKYVGVERSQGDTDDADQEERQSLFEPCDKTVELYLGYGSPLTRMLTGHFTTLEPNFPSSGAPSLNVRGLNVLHRLRIREHSYAWRDKRASEIAQDVGRIRERGQPRFPYPIEISQKALDQETPIPYVAQKNQHDIDFLLTLARRRGYAVFITEHDSGPRVYFVPTEISAPDVTVLEWGKSLIDFRPTLTTANQVRSVTVRGWDRRRRRVISKQRSLDQESPCCNQDLQELLLRSCNAREAVVVDRPVFTPAEADELARRELCERNKDIVKATGTTVGLPTLRAGRYVEIEGLGQRFGGTYFVTETTHTIGEGGYTTRFSARREQPEQPEQGGTPA